MKAILTTNQTTINSSYPIEQVANTDPGCSLIKKKELAKRLSVSTRTVDEWARKRIIPYLHLGPRFYLYDYDAVLAALRKQYQVEVTA